MVNQNTCSMDFLNPAQHLQFLQHLVHIQRDIVEFEGAITQVVQARRRRRVGNRRKAVWVRPWCLRWPIYEHYKPLLAEVNQEDLPAFQKDPDMFFELVDRLTPRIEKQDTWYRKLLQR